MRKAQEGALEIGRGHCVSVELEPGHAVGNERAQGALDAENELRATLPQERQVAAKLERVAEALLGMNEKTFSGGIIALPRGGELRRELGGPSAQTRFVM